MRWTFKLVFEAVPGSPVEHEVGRIERAEEISPASVGLTIAVGKALLASLQAQILTAQVQQHVASMNSGSVAIRMFGRFRCKLCGGCSEVRGEVVIMRRGRHSRSRG
jgi:hypothetical protein